ncbi:MAG: hypothetical protein AB1611_17465 [bacterium]
MNDVMRYWRTWAVDYQAKRWEAFAPNSNWGLRFLKLIISRKIVYAGTLASLLLTDKAAVEYFYEQFTMPPLARISQLYDMLEEEYLESLAVVLKIADLFLSKLSMDCFREEANNIHSPYDIKENTEFFKMRLKGRDLQKALEKIFFHSSVLKEKAITYMSF